MSYRCLADFLEELGQAGELVRVATAVDPRLEATEITRRIHRQSGPSILFGAASGHDIPLVANLCGTEGRLCRALGVQSLDEVTARVDRMAQSDGPEGWFDRLKTAPSAAMLGGMVPRQVKNGACQQIARLGSDVDLAALPLLQSAPEEPPTITAAVLLSADTEDGRQIGGRYDLQRVAADRLAACWSPCDEPARLWITYRKRQEKMPLAAVLGGDPTILLAAMATAAPRGVETLALAGLLRQRPIDVVHCRTVNLDVPADAEIVIEGYVDPAEPLIEAGPTCGANGYYATRRLAPVMHVTAVTHRANPVFPALVRGEPPHESSVIDRAMQRIFLPLVKLSMPELVDYDLPMDAAAEHWATISIDKTYAGQTRRVAHAAWGMRPLMFAKLLVVVDAEVDVRDHRQVLAAMANHVSPGRDVFFQQGPPNPSDAAATPGVLAQRMAIDATAKLPEEQGGPPPERASMTPEIVRLVGDRWTEYGLGPAS